MESFVILFDDNLNDKLMELGKIIGRMVLGIKLSLI
jgi:hypothetical protein